MAENWKDDIREQKNWGIKILMVIDKLLNPDAPDWPYGVSDEHTIYFIRWVKKNGKPPT